MSWVAAAIVGGSLISGVLGSNAAQSAASTQAGAQEQAAQTQLQMFNTINSQEQPFIQAGYGANTTLNQLLGLTSGNPGGGLSNGYLTQTFNPTQDQLNNYPGYQFALNTGEQAVRNADTPANGALSGATMKDLMSFAEGTAAQNYGNYFNQYQTQQNNIFSRLSGILGLGQNAASNVGTSGTQLGTGIAQAQAAAGASQAAGTIGAANALTGSINSGAGMGLAYLMNQNMANALANSNSGGS